MIQNRDNEDSKLCPCWESQLPTLSRQSANVKRWAVGPKLETCIARDSTADKAASDALGSIEEKLLQIGLDEPEIEIVIQRDIEGSSFDHIAELTGLRNQQQVNRKYQKALAKIARAGFQSWLHSRIKEDSDE